jgi:hypothetical protein
MYAYILCRHISKLGCLGYSLAINILQSIHYLWKYIKHPLRPSCKKFLAYLKFQVLRAASMKTALSWVVALCSLQRFTDVFRGACCLIALITEAESTSETSADLYRTTRRSNPEYSQPTSPWSVPSKSKFYHKTL